MNDSRGAPREPSQSQPGHESLAERWSTPDSGLDSRLAVFVDHLPIPLWIKDLDGRLLYVNRRYCESIQMSSEQVLGKTDFELFSEAAAQQFRRNDLHTIAAGKALEFEEPALLPDGSIRWFTCIKLPLPGPAGKPDCVGGIAVDIGPLKATESALRRSEHRYRTLFDRNPDAVFTLDTTGRFTAANPACETILGYKTEELLLRTCVDVCPPECRVEVLACFQDCLNGHPRDLKTAVLRKDGVRTELLITGGCLWEEGRVVGLLCSARDITEPKRCQTRLQEASERLDRALTAGRTVAWEYDAATRHSTRSANALGCSFDVTDLKLAQRRLSDALEQLHLALEAAQMGAFEWDLSSGQVNWTGQLCRLFGYEPGSVTASFEFWRSHVHPEDLERVLQTRERAKAQRTPWSYEYRIRRADGQIRWLSVRGQFSYNPAGMAIHCRGVAFDITEAKTLEKTARESESVAQSRLAELQTLYATAPVGLGLVDSEFQYLRVNEALARMNGLPVPDHAGKRISEVIGPTLWKKLLPVLQHVQAGENVRNLELEGSTPANPEALRHWLAGFHRVQTPQGESIGVGFAVQDITELKRAVEARHRYELLVAQTDDIILFVEVGDGRILDANSAAEKTYGYSRAELRDLTLYDLRSPETHPLLPGQMALANTEGARYETIHRCKQGTSFPVEVTSRGATIGEKRLLLSIVRDITERKRAAQALREAQASLQAHASDLERAVQERTSELQVTNRALNKEMEDRKQLERAILARVEAERQRLGRELHDGLSQILTAVKFKLGLLQRKLQRGVPVDAAEAGDLEKEVNHAIEQARSMAQGLNPVSLVGQGLTAALKRLAESVEAAFQVQCNCRIPTALIIADHEIALHLYRIAQEAVHNAIQHSQCHRIEIGLEDCVACRCLTVLDDGIGFSENHAVMGMGLQNMHARANAIGGRLDIQPRPEGGTMVVCSWPNQRFDDANSEPKNI